MATSSILLILALLILVALFLVRPFVQESSAKETELVEYSSLLAERERIIEALLELDFDQQLGKVPEEIYASQRENLLQEGGNILQKLEQENALESSPDQGAVDELEAMIAAHKAKRS
jgi:hypothetical protein